MGPFSFHDAVFMIKTAASREISKAILTKIAKKSALDLDAGVFEFLWCHNWSYQPAQWEVAGRYVCGSHRPFRPPPPPPCNKGLINWVYENKKPVHAQNLRDVSTAEDKIIKNTLDGIEFPSSIYYEGHKETEDELIIPMIFGENVVGVINIEFYRKTNINNNTVQSLSYFGQEIAEALMICVAEEKRKLLFNEELLVMDLEEDSFPLLGRPRTCFFATEFKPPYKSVESALSEFLDDHNYKVHTVYPTLGNTLISEINKQIKSCHLFIADVTNLNKNVMIEIGMAIIHKRTILQIYNSRNPIPEVPFDLKTYHISSYTIDTNADETKVDLSQNFKNQFYSYV